MSTLIGLTGGIGSGKSLAASYFKELGANIIHADRISRRLVEPGQAAWKEIFDEFGENYFNPDQSLNREKIAAEVFQNNEKRILLEKIIHHRVLAEEQNLYYKYLKIIFPLYISYKTNSMSERLRAMKKSEIAITVKTNFVYLSGPIIASSRIEHDLHVQLRPFNREMQGIDRFH